MNRILGIILISMVLLSSSRVSYAAEDKCICDEGIVVIPVEENQTTSIDIPLGNDNVATLRVKKVNGMVYADAHGRYYMSNGNTVSSYGMYVSFTVKNSSISVVNGEQYTAYHNASTSGYIANYEKSITGEGTKVCTAKTIYRLSNSPDSQITIKLVIDNQGATTVHFDGNYNQHNSNFNLN